MGCSPRHPHMGSVLGDDTPPHKPTQDLLPPHATTQPNPTLVKRSMSCLVTNLCIWAAKKQRQRQRANLSRPRGHNTLLRCFILACKNSIPRRPSHTQPKPHTHRQPHQCMHALTVPFTHRSTVCLAGHVQPHTWCTCTYARAHTHAHTHTCVHTPGHTATCTQARASARVFAYRHARRHVHTSTHTHTHTCTRSDMRALTHELCNRAVI
jgi:hypothetical protein